MMLLEGVVVLAVAGLIIYAVISLLMRGVAPPRVLSGAAGQWQVAHFAVEGSTHVVVRKVLPDAVTVVDEHHIATLAENDPAYEVKFLEAMAQARERRALYESEETG